MIIVSGHLTVQPEDRDTYLGTCRPVVEAGRVAPGCLDFAISADLTDPARINVLERWEDQGAVEVFRGAGVGEEQAAMIVAAHVLGCDVSDVRVLA